MPGTRVEVHKIKVYRYLKQSITVRKYLAFMQTPCFFGVLRRLSTVFCVKFSKNYTETTRGVFMNARMSIALIRATNRCMRRSKGSKIILG